MAAGLNKLSAKAVKDRKDHGRLGDGGGLWLNITNSGSKAWVYRWTPKGGKPREIGLAPIPLFR